MYDPRATRYDVTRAIPTPELEAIAAAVLGLVPDPGGRRARLLDLGCGTGRFLTPLARLAAGRVETVGLDLAARMLGEVAGTRRSVPLLQASATRLPFRAGVFDGVLAVSLLHLLGDSLEPALQQVGRVLRPGGVLMYGSTHHGGAQAGLYEELRFGLPRLVAPRPHQSGFDVLPHRIGAQLSLVETTDVARWPVEVRIGTLVESMAAGEWSESFGWEAAQREAWHRLTSAWTADHGLTPDDVLGFDKIFRLRTYVG